MRNCLWLFFFAAILSSCANYYADVGVGYDSFATSSNPRSLFRVVGETPGCLRAYPSIVCAAEYSHHSSVLDGKPFNNREDDNVNQWSGYLRIPLK